MESIRDRATLSINWTVFIRTVCRLLLIILAKSG